MLRFCGFNFEELKSKDDAAVRELKEFKAKTQSETQKIFSTALHEILVEKGNKIRIRSPLNNEGERLLEFHQSIKDLCSNNETCWVLCSDGSLSSFDFNDLIIRKLIDSNVSHIACTAESMYCISATFDLIMISDNTKKIIHKFANHQKVRKIVAGAEHCCLLTSNGDVFSFGCGLRGALGLGDISSSDKPTQIEDLAGLKIVDIGAGLFHSVAVSSFGDVYTFGWNTHGQMGVPKTARHTFKKAFDSHQQVFTWPLLINMNENIVEVHCGSRHTIIRSEAHRIFCCGLNNFGQLGIPSIESDVGKFTCLGEFNSSTKIICGFWSTYIFDDQL